MVDCWIVEDPTDESSWFRDVKPWNRGCRSHVRCIVHPEPLLLHILFVTIYDYHMRVHILSDTLKTFPHASSIGHLNLLLI